MKIRVETQAEAYDLTVPVGGRLLDYLQEASIPVNAACGGNATCHKCRVRVREGFLAPTAADRKAFRADDYKTAEKYQSSALKDNFDSTEQFRSMMRRGYPQVANYKSVTFGEARCDEKAEQVQIRVTLTGKDNVTVRMVYVMVKEGGDYDFLG